MKEFLSHVSAAGQWDIPNIETVLGFQITEIDPAHITVTRHDAKFSNNREMIHSCVLDLPAGVVTTRNGRAVASPELLFLEPIVSLITATSRSRAKMEYDQQFLNERVWM